MPLSYYYLTKQWEFVYLVYSKHPFIHDSHSHHHHVIYMFISIRPLLRYHFSSSISSLLNPIIPSLFRFIPPLLSQMPHSWCPSSLELHHPPILSSIIPHLLSSTFPCVAKAHLLCCIPPLSISMLLLFDAPPLWCCIPPLRSPCSSFFDAHSKFNSKFITISFRMQISILFQFLC